MDVKVGDVVHVRGVVQYWTVDGAPMMGFAEQPDIIRVGLSSIVHVEPRSLKVGDTVRFIRFKNGTPGGQKIVAIAGDDAWLEWPEGSHMTAKLVDLEHF